MDTIPIILASASPRRLAILRALGVRAEVRRPHCLEVTLRDDPAGTVGVNARRKALSVRASHPNAAIIAADTVVCFEGRVLGKPRDTEEARAWLTAYAGKTQTVYTAVALLYPGAQEPSLRIEATSLQFKNYGARTVEAYLALARPLDRAGAYDVNVRGDLLIAGRVGSFTNAMGLPRGVVRDWLASHGLLGAER